MEDALLYQKLLKKASLSKEFLYSNSTTHSFVFGAIAELVDNAKDAGADRIVIEKTTEYLNQKEVTCLSFLDNGCGMSPKELEKVMSYGYSVKDGSPNKIGKYGNGLKAGSMRLASDCIVFTKKGETQSVLFLSKTFLNEEKLEEVYIAMPHFSVNSVNPHRMDNTEKHMLERRILIRSTPFGHPDKLAEMFSKIKSESGTLVVLFNLRMDEMGELELNFDLDALDIRILDEFESSKERLSLRAYLSILYYTPTMRITLRGQNVIPKRFRSDLYLPITFNMEPKNIRAAMEKKIQQLQEQIRHQEGQSERAEFLRNITTVTRDDRVQERYLSTKIGHMKSEQAELEKQLHECKKNKKDTISVTFGFNLANRQEYGCMVYCNERLIEFGHEAPCQKWRKDGKCIPYVGVVALVKVPYSIMVPTSNKQEFESQRDRNLLYRYVNDYMIHYVENCVPSLLKNRTITEIWTEIGYSEDPTETRRSNIADRDMKEVTLLGGHTVQCDLCLKWRKIPYTKQFSDVQFVCNWQCTKNEDLALRSCTIPENLTALEPINKGTLSAPRKESKKIKKEFIKTELIVRGGSSQTTQSSLGRTSLQSSLEEEMELLDEQSCEKPNILKRRISDGPAIDNQKKFSDKDGNCRKRVNCLSEESKNLEPMKRFVKRNEDDVLYIGSKIVNKPGLRISTRKSDIETFSEPSTSRSSCSSKNQEPQNKRDHKLEPEINESSTKAEIQKHKQVYRSAELDQRQELKKKETNSLMENKELWKNMAILMNYVGEKGLFPDFAKRKFPDTDSIIDGVKTLADRIRLEHNQTPSREA